MAMPTKTIISSSKYDDPVWETIFTAKWNSGDTSDATFSTNFKGIILTVVLVIPAMTATTITGQLQILDSQSNVIFDTGEKAQGNTYIYNIYEPFIGAVSMVIGVSGNPSTSGATLIGTLRGY